jgi:hypothetical protein
MSIGPLVLVVIAMAAMSVAAVFVCAALTEVDSL